MDFNQVKYFLAISETLNFTRAAERCRVTQPALTQAIKRLETELGGKLINRDGRNTELTNLGQSLRTHFEQIDHTRGLINRAAEIASSDERGELNIGLMCTIGPAVLSSFFKQFQLTHPDISLVLHDVTPSAISDLLLSGTLDGAFCSAGNTLKGRVNRVKLFDESIVVAFARGHAFSHLKEVPLSAIAAERYIDRLHCEFRSIFLDYCAESGLDLQVVLRSQREDWIQGLIGDGLGVSVLPEYSLIHQPLESRPIDDSRMQRQIDFAFIEHSESTPGFKLLFDQVNSHNWTPIGE